MSDRHPYVGERVWRALPTGVEEGKVMKISYAGSVHMEIALGPRSDDSFGGVTVGGVSLDYYRSHFHPWPPPPDLKKLDLVEEWLDDNQER